jgi:hypothetical protein
MYLCCGYTLLWSIQPLALLSLIPLTHPHYWAFNTHIYILYLHRCNVLQHYWCSIILFSFPSLPEFHREFQLQMCSTYEFVYDHACSCVYVYHLDLFTCEWTCGLCLSKPGLLHLTWCHKFLICTSIFK